MPRVLRACISPALCNSHLFVLQQGRGAPSPPRRVPRAAPGTGTVPASHGERQALGRGMLLQRSRLRRRALSQPPGPWPSVGEAPERDYTFVVLFLVLVSHCALVVWITMVTGVIFPQENNPSPKQLWSHPFGHFAWMAVCLSWGGLAPQAWGGKGEQRSAKAQQRLVLHLWPGVSHFPPPWAGWLLDGGGLKNSCKSSK